MSDQEKKTSSGEIDWTAIEQQAKAILDGASPPPMDWSSQDPPPAAEPEPDPEPDPEPELVLPLEEPDPSGQYASFQSEAPPFRPGQWPPQPAPESPDPGASAYYRQPSAPPETPPQSPPRKRKRVRSVGVTFLVAVLYVVSVLSIAFLLATLGWRWANDLLSLDKEDRSYTIQIAAGDSIHDVAQDLYENGMIEYPYLFEVFAGFTNKAENITSGSYDLNTSMDYSALLNNMSQSSQQRSTVTVTIPEGYTVKEIFQLLEQQGVCTVEELEQSALQDEFDYSFLQDLERNDNPYWMEGYLFPDTYEFYKDSDAKVAIFKMLYNFSVKFTDEMKTRAERLGYSEHEIMIIASIIEKETDGQDQRDIASVIYNRLQPDNQETLGKLQMDSTIQYILEERKENLTEEDLQIESPYNTYLNEGLPAGTICNPGMEAIEAALYPNNTTYYYFILGNDGITHFFSDYGEFNNYRMGIEVETAQETDASEEEETE